MLIDRAPWTALVDDDGSNLVGTVWNKDKVKTVLLDPIDAALPAAWQAVPFSAANFTASSGTWTGMTQDQYKWLKLSDRAYLVVGRFTGGQAMSASTVWLYINMPAPMPASVEIVNSPLSYSIVGGPSGTGVVHVAAGKIGLLRDILGTPWPAQAASSSFLYFQLMVVC